LKLPFFKCHNFINTFTLYATLIMQMLLLYLMLTFSSSLLFAQDLKEIPLAQEAIKSNILKIYATSNFEAGVRYTLFKDSSFKFEHYAVAYHFYSSGRWHKDGKDYLLNSYIDSNDVPVEFKCITIQSEIDGITRKHPYDKISTIKTLFWIPLNLKHQPLPDSRIFINNDTTYCFPYFDTCINQFTPIQRVRIEFGNGFRSKWQTLPDTKFRKILCIAKTTVDLSEYISYKEYRLKVIKSSVKLPE
jgi:hypothetical protein